MKLVQYKDKDGFLHQSLIRDNMKLTNAHYGIPDDPPDLRQLDWDAIVRELNEQLIAQNLITLADITQGTLSNTILRVIQNKIVQLYKQQSYVQNQNGQNQNGENGHNNNEAIKES